MHFFGAIGALLTLSGFSVNVYLTFLWISGVGIGHRPLLMLGILLMVVGIQFFSIGLLGEMFTKAFGKLERNLPIRQILRGTIQELKKTEL